MLVLVLVLGGTPKVAAQSIETVWAPPINLSRSGAASSPSLVFVPNGPTLAVWKDKFDGLVYSILQDGEWSPPKGGNFPFDESVPQLVADSKGNIHAFWLEKDSTLQYSQISLTNFGTGSWPAATKLDDAASALKVFVTSKDEVHLAYVRTANSATNPAGVYFRKRIFSSKTWTPPILLYTSSYLRLLESTDIKMDLIEMESPEGVPSLYLMWDDHPQAQILLAISTDDGNTWEDPIKIRGASDTAAPPIAFGMVRTDETLLFLWQEKTSDTNCRQLYQTFALDGTAIGPPQAMLSQFPVCPEKNQLFSTPQGVLLQTSLFGLNYLLAWDGSAWSEPQLQQELSNFVNPETLQTIQLECLNMVSVGEDEIYLLACDNGDTQGDIWFTSRKLTSTENWFSNPTGWKTPASFFSTDNELSSLAVVADAKGRLHAIWVQAVAGTNGQAKIYYARWDGKQWAYIVSVISPPSGRATGLDAAIDAAGQLYLVWSGGEAGEIYFSWANADLAGTPSEWSKPVALPMARSVGTSPDIVVGENGTIYVAYAIPLNEHRGIYLTTSRDGGETWTDPQQILDGVAAGWEIVDAPSLSTTADGTLQALFWQLPPPDGAPVKGLYQSRSEDNGATWSAPEEVIRAELVSSWLEHFGPEVTYRLWQENRNEELVTYLEASPDLGLTWTEPVNFTDFDAAVVGSELVLDHSGLLRLLQLVDDTNAGLVLQESVWNGNSWSKEERTIVDVAGTQDKSWLLQASVSSDGILGVLIAGVKNTALVAPGTDIYFTSRSLEESAPPPPPVLIPTPEGTLAPNVSTPTETPTTATTPQAASPAASGNSSSTLAVDNTILGPIVGLVASGLLVVLAFVIFSKLTNRSG